MKKLLLILTLISSFALLAEDQNEIGKSTNSNETNNVSVSNNNDSKGMISAFMGTTDVGGGEVGGNSGTTAISSIIAPITNNNTTISTPYSYKK